MGRKVSPPRLLIRHMAVGQIIQFDAKEHDVHALRQFVYREGWKGPAYASKRVGDTYYVVRFA